MITLKEYLNIPKRIISEGGNAAISLTDKLKERTGNHDLHYVKATATPDIIKEVKQILQFLRTNNLIEPREPSYMMGSTRLFAISAGLSVFQPNEIETPEVVRQAMKNKTSFGDIDIDVYLADGISHTDVAAAIEQYNDKKYAAQQGGDDVNIAVVVGNTNDVIQVDLVNIKGHEKYAEYGHFSSLADLSLGIKGMVRDTLIRAIVKTTKVGEGTTEILSRAVEESEPYQHIIDKLSKKYNEPITYKIKYSLGKEGLNYIVSFRAGDKTIKIPPVYKKIPINKLQNFISGSVAQPIPYDDMNIVAGILGFSHPDQMRHTKTMAEVVSTFDKERRQIIWNILEGVLVKGSRLNAEEAQTALTFLRPYFGDIETEKENNQSV